MPVTERLNSAPAIRWLLGGMLTILLVVSVVFAVNNHAVVKPSASELAIAETVDWSKTIWRGFDSPRTTST